MSSPSDDQPPGEPQRYTQERPLVQPTGATAAGSAVPPEDGSPLYGAPQHGAPQHGAPQYGAPQHAAAQPPVPPPLPAHPGAVTPVPVAMEEPQPTGPVELIPGLPGTPPVPPPAGTTPPTAEDAVPARGPVWPDTLDSDAAPGGPKRAHKLRVPQDRAAVLGLGLAVLAMVLLELGLGLHFGTRSYWSAVPLWSAFATLCAALGAAALAAAFPSGSRLRSNAVWRTGLAGLVGLAVFWLLVVLAVVATDRGFLLTAALGALGAALWVGPGRKA